MHSLFYNSRRKLSQGLLFWREIGEGLPIVFLHGAWNDSSQWVTIMELMSQGFHCFAPDLLGFGESECPNIHYSINLQVECLAEFLQALKLERIFLVGHSLGGWIAASYALKYPEQVYSLTLLAPEGVAIEGQQQQWRQMQQLVKRSPLIFKLLRLLQPLTKLLGWDVKIERDWQLYQLFLQYPTACQILFQRQQPEIMAELLQEHLYQMQAPILILQGGKDTPEAQARSQTYAQYAPNAVLKMIAHAGNEITQNCAGLIAEDIQDFIKGQGWNLIQND